MLPGRGVSRFVPSTSTEGLVAQLPEPAPRRVGLLAVAVLFALTGFARAAKGEMPTISFSANPTSIASGESTTLSWCASGAQRCEMSGDWTSRVPDCGSQTVSPNQNASYTLTCKNHGNFAAETVNVTVVANEPEPTATPTPQPEPTATPTPEPDPAPTLSLSASPSSIVRGESATLSWSSTDATSCTASGAWSGSKATSGTQSVSPSDTATYSLDCSGPGGSVARSATVTVESAAAPFTGSYEAEDATLVSPMTVGSDANALAGQYIRPASGSSSRNPSPEATLSFSVPSSGTYYLWARMMGPDSSSDALYVGIDSSWDRIFPNGTGSYEWIPVETAENNGVLAFSLTAGSHTLRVGRGEIDARLDALYLTTDPNDVPTDAPAPAPMPTPAPDPAPTVNLSSSPSSISNGDSSTLSWSSTDATSCSASGAWSGNKTLAGMQTVSPSANATYTLTCTGPGGSANDSATVTVSAAAPTLSFSASPSSISSGNSSALSWTSSNATGCSASGGWSGDKSLSGTQSMSPATTTTYNLTCTGPGGSVSRSATVDVAQSSPTAPQGFGADTPGGTGKPVYHVTNLNDSGAGSLRDAVSQGNRYVVFDVAGTIQATGNDVKILGAFVTIDGTTAPAPGITLSGWGLQVDGDKGAHDIIIRGIRVRGVGENGVGDGITIRDGAYNVLVDQVSVGDTADGSIDVSHDAHDVTIQWSLFEKKPSHNLLSIASYGATRVTYHHNLFIGGESRSPQASWNIAGTPSEVVADIRNNLVWDFGSFGTTVIHGAIANVIGNYYYSTSRFDPDHALRIRTDEGSRTYANGNFSQNGADVDGESTESVPFAAEPLETTDACSAAYDVVAFAGPRPLDAVDQGFVSQVQLSCY